MRLFKYIFGFWAVVAIYALFAFLAGPKGLSAYNFLLSERDRQWDNIRELGIMNEELERTRNNLLHDHDTLMVHARQMGFGYEGERFIRIVGLSNIKPIPAEVGNVYSAYSPSYISVRTVKITAIVIGFLLFAFLFMLEAIYNRTR